VRFARGSSTLVPESEPVLDEIARAMRGNPSLTRVAVEGHASTDERDVMALTERRARAVVDRLVAAGVARDRLVVRGRGAGQPIDTNATADARARNRRVEVRVEGESSEATAPPDGGVACAAPSPAPAERGR